MGTLRAANRWARSVQAKNRDRSTEPTHALARAASLSGRRDSPVRYSADSAQPRQPLAHAD